MTVPSARKNSTSSVILFFCSISAKARRGSLSSPSGAHQRMATLQLTGTSFVSSKRAVAATAAPLSCFEGLPRRDLWGLTVKVATVVAPKYTSVKPLGDRVLVKIKSSGEKTSGGVLLPSIAQSKPQSGEVVAIGDGRTIGKNKVDIGIEIEAQVVYSKYVGTEIDFNGSNHLPLKKMMSWVFSILVMSRISNLSMTEF